MIVPRSVAARFTASVTVRAYASHQRSSLLIVGPTQVGKTSALVIPALLRWSDALVVTSVKNDVVTATRDWRATLGEVQVLEPGLDGGTTWNPLEGVRTLRHALRVARDLTNGPADRGETEFWNSLATKVVGSLLMLALQRSRDIFDVARTIECRNFDEWLGRRTERSWRRSGDLPFARAPHDRRSDDDRRDDAHAVALPPAAGARSLGRRRTQHAVPVQSPRGATTLRAPLPRGTCAWSSRSSNVGANWNPSGA